uniref:DUF4794 domain-containing protein n=1 Tax=Dendroctonus ponderosae TaxID=77166 RepID=A0AAR5P910_DENPD
MFLKSCVLYYIVCGGVIFAELPQDTRNLQDDENLEGYLPSGWKPSGPAFKIPESPQFTFKSPNEGSWSYLPPQTNGQNPEVNSQVTKLFDGSENTDTGFRSSSSTAENTGQVFERTGTEVQVDLTYSIPKETLAAPPNQPPVTYGPPQEEVTTAVPSLTEELTTTVLPTTTEIIFEEFSNDTLNNDEGKQKENLLEETKDAGARVYYIYHPTGLLQKVSYRTKDDQANMAYSAELKYENVEPIRSPVYTYDPETYAFKRLQ